MALPDQSTADQDPYQALRKLVDEMERVGFLGA